MVSTQAGGWTRNGEPFSSGSTVRGENGATYKLTLSNGGWTAEFMPPDPVPVALGNSGEAIAVEIQEDGTYVLAGEPLTSGQVRDAENGNQYRFTLGFDGTWTAEYVAPDPTHIRLGLSNDTVSVVRQEDGTYTLDGMTLMSGDVRETENGNSYRFTEQPDGQWVAEFVTGPPTPVALGNSGGTVQIVAQENGTYTLDDTPLYSGQVRVAANGNSYRFIQRALGVWVAEFVPPDPTAVALGNSGDSVSLQRLENGDFTLAEEVVASGQVRTVANGNRYRFILGGEGTWTAEFVSSPPLTVALGESGATVSVTVLENRNYLLDGESLTTGQVRTINGNSYRFEIGASGAWTAIYVPEMVTVTLGRAGGSIVLARRENGDFTRNGSIVEHGQIVTGNGNRYRLTLGNGRWIAEHVPDEVQVNLPDSDAVVTLLEQEDGRLLHNGSLVRDGSEITVGGSTYELRFANGRWRAAFVEGRFTVELGSRGDFITLIRRSDGTIVDEDGDRVRSGSLVRSPNTRIRYILSFRNGVWSSRLYVPPTTGGGSGGGSSSSGGGAAPDTVEDLEEALPTEFLRKTDGSLEDQGELLKPNQPDAVDVDYSSYRGSGAVETETFVDAAREVLQDAVDRIKPLIGGTEGQLFAARALIKDRWPKVRAAFDAIFDGVGQETAGKVLLRNLPADIDDIDEEDRLDDLEDLLEAIDDVEAFKRELRASGEFGDFGEDRDAIRDDAEEIYNASKGSLAIGTTENTRFGVIAEPSGGDSSTAEEIVTRDLGSLTRAFAYSPLDPSTITSLPNRGTARYTGRTFAIEPERGDLFAGTINLLASFGIERIVAEITNLTHTEDGDAWEFDGRSVTKIELPVIEEDRFDPDTAGEGHFKAGTGAESTIALEGTQFDRSANSEFEGYFVDSEGDEVFGTWAILGTNPVRLLDGAFGADRQSTSRASLPSSDSHGRDIEFEDISANTNTALDDDNDKLTITTSEFALEDREFSLNHLYRRSSDDSMQEFNGVNHTLRVQFRRTSYTRFGAWAHTTHTTPNNVESTGFFGYSSLAATTYEAAEFPRNVEAQYVGHTVAVGSDGALYDGDFVLTVDWSDTGGELESVIRNLRNVSGRARFEIGGIEVDLIAFRGPIDNLVTGRELSFSSPEEALIEYLTGSDTELNAGIEHTGHFLGSPPGVDGPYAVLGSWRVVHGGSDIKGEFGADLDTSP